MLEPDYLADLSLELEKMYYDLETDILKDMARRIKLNDYSITSTAEYQKKVLESLGNSQKEISSQISKLLKISQKEADRILSQSVYKSVEADNEIFKEAYDKGVISSFSFSKDTLKPLINKGIQALNNELDNICGTTAKNTQKAFINASNNAYLSIQSGAFSYEQAVATEIKKLAKDGLGVIEYRSGAKRRLEGAIRNAVRTAVNQTACKCQDQNFEEMGGNLVETSSHMGARPTHAEWQGQIFWRKEEIKGYRNFEEATKYGSGEGLGGWNCRHSWYPYFPGISHKVFEKYDTQENEELYNLTQEQRYNERMIREWDRRNQVCKAAGIDNTKEARKLKEWRERQSLFINKYPELKRQYSREKGYVSYGKNGKIDISSIKIAGALDPTSKKANKHAEQYYESVRKMKTDYKKIAKNTGFDIDEIKRIKNYLFIDEHDLITGRKRLDPDYMIAESWRRLIDGKNIQPHDLTLLNHEILEHNLVLSGLTQDQAHIQASKKYNYHKESEKYHAEINKRKKKQ